MTTTLTIVPIRGPGCDEPSYFAVMDQHGRERCSGTSEFDARTALARELVYYVADGWRIVAMTETEVTIERARFCEPSGLDEAIQAARTPAQLVSTIVAAAREMGHERARHLLSLTG